MQDKLTRRQHVALHFLSTREGKAIIGLPSPVVQIEKMGLIRRVIGAAGFDGSPDKYIWELTKKGKELVEKLGAPNPTYEVPAS